MTRILSALAAALTSAALVAVAGPAGAQGPAHYVAVPAAPAAKASVITRSTPWRLTANGAYVASRAPERDLVLCQLLARDVGPLRSFSAGGAALDADELGKCNSRAKGGAGAAMAATGAAAGGR